MDFICEYALVQGIVKAVSVHMVLAGSKAQLWRCF